MVKLCFLVKVRKATGRSEDGGSKIGKTEILARGGFDFRKGCTGVPNPGDEEKTGSDSRQLSPASVVWSIFGFDAVVVAQSLQICLGIENHMELASRRRIGRL
jgi:hypothetical protein